MSELLVRADWPAPWSTPGWGLLGFVVVALGLIGLTLWSYRRHPEISPRRLGILLMLRLLALALTLLTVMRPSVGIQDTPAIPSSLVIGIDISASMNVPDELNGRARIDEVRRVLEKCEPILDDLKSSQNVELHLYGFGAEDFTTDTGGYDPARPADVLRSDYAAYLKRTFDRHQADPHVRAHVLIGDGIDNGDVRPLDAAGRWKQSGRSLQTFAVGSATADDSTKDVALVSLFPTSGTSDGAVYVKTDFTLRLVANAFGFSGVRVPVKVQFDTGSGYVDVATQETTFTQEVENTIDLKLKAPDQPGQIKVRAEVPLASVVGDVVPANNVIETYLTVSKEGMRVLIVNRANVEQASIRRALAAEGTRIDLYQVIRQTLDPAQPSEREDLDFEKRAYDVIILGNVSAKQLTTLDPSIPAKIREQVLNRGVGLILTGGHATLGGTASDPDATGWLGTPEIEELLPVELMAPGGSPGRGAARYQYLPTVAQQGHYLNRVAESLPDSLSLWARLNESRGGMSFSRLTAVNPLGRVKPSAVVFAVADPAAATRPVPAPPDQASALAPLLVGHEIGAGGRGRVLVFAGQDSYLWQRLGLPQSRDGIQLHSRFWRQLVRWCAHQDTDEGQVFARPEIPRLPVGSKQTIRIGVRQPGGTPARKPRFPVVKILAPGEDPATAPNRAYLPDEDGVFRVPFEPTQPGEHTVQVEGIGTDAAGAEVRGEATARFLVFATATDETLVKAARPDVLERLATAGGGRARRLDELPAYLEELRQSPPDLARPRPKFYPNWGRDTSAGFLPAWFVLFTLVLAAEWGLRRHWGLV